MIQYFIILLSLIGLNIVKASDPLYPLQWALSNQGKKYSQRTGETDFRTVNGKVGFDLDYHWIPGKEKKEVVVAVLDSGVDYNHPELSGRLWMRPGCDPDNSKISCVGKNFLDTEADVMDDVGHGTHVTGIIIARHNDQGVRGILQSSAKVMPLKVLSSEVKSFMYNGRLVSDYLAEAIEYAVRNKVDVINISAGYPRLIYTSRLDTAIVSAASANIPIIAAAGNNQKNTPVYPCRHTRVLCVGAASPDGSVASYSNWGHFVDLYAPGSYIVSTYPQQGQESRILRINGYEQSNGSSQAAPFVSAIAARIKQLEPEVNLKQIILRLLSSAKTISRGDEQFVNNGMVSMRKALHEELPATFTRPNFKVLAPIKVQSDLSFKFPIKLERLTGSDPLHLKVRQETGKVVYDQELNFGDEETIKVLLEDNVTSLEESSERRYQMEIREVGTIRRYRFDLTLIREETDVVKKHWELENLSSLRLEGIKTSFLKRVFDPNSNSQYLPEFFLKEYRHYRFVRLDEKELISHKIDIAPGDGDLIQVLKLDHNLDGEKDYLLVSAFREEGSIGFFIHFRNKDMRPLYPSHPNYKWKVSTTNEQHIEWKNELFNFSGNKNNMQLHTIYDHTLKKNVLSFILSRNSILETQDRASDLLFIEPRNPRERFLYLQPADSGKIEFKHFQNHNNIKKVREEISLNYYDQISFIFYLEYSKQTTYFFAEVDSPQRQLYLKVGFQNGEVISVQEVSHPYGVGSLADFSLLHTREGQMTLFRANERHKALILTLTKSRQWTFQDIESSGYDQPFLSLIASSSQFENSLFQTRSDFVYFEKDKTFSYPLNRESSFPNVAFSETFEAFESGPHSFGIFVNSTLLSEDLLFGLNFTPQGVRRPIQNSYQLPQSCAYVGLVELDQEQHFLMHCKNSKTTTKLFATAIE